MENTDYREFQSTQMQLNLQLTVKKKALLFFFFFLKVYSSLEAKISRLVILSKTLYSTTVRVIVYYSNQEK